MSETQSIAAASPGPSVVHAAIARAAERTGVDFDFLLAQARIESSLDPKARARTSSAAGLYQFTKGSWLETVGRHGAEHGLGWAQAAIGGGRLTGDPALRAQVLALRFDPETASAMAGELAGDNRDALKPVLGREPDAAELYLAHFLGMGGANRFLYALQEDPEQSAAALLPSAAAANRGIFYSSTGAVRSVAAVMDVLRNKVGDAMGQPFDGAAGLASQSSAGWQASYAGGGLAARVVSTSLDPTRSRPPSMAETVRRTFDLASGGGAGLATAPGFVRSAYENLKSLGL